MKNTLETKEHILMWIKQLLSDFQDNYVEIKLNEEFEDNTLDEMIEQTVKLKSYLEKLRDNKYE